MIAALLSDFLPYIIGAIGVGLGILGLRGWGKTKADNATLRENIKTRKKINAADLPSTADDARKRMHERDPNQR